MKVPGRVSLGAGAIIGLAGGRLLLDRGGKLRLEAANRWVPAFESSCNGKGREPSRLIRSHASSDSEGTVLENRNADVCSWYRSVAPIVWVVGGWVGGWSCDGSRTCRLSAGALRGVQTITGRLIATPGHSDKEAREEWWRRRPLPTTSPRLNVAVESVVRSVTILHLSRSMMDAHDEQQHRKLCLLYSCDLRCAGPGSSFAMECLDPNSPPDLAPTSPHPRFSPTFASLGVQRQPMPAWRMWSPVSDLQAGRWTPHNGRNSKLEVEERT